MAAPQLSMTPVPGWADPGPFVGREAAWTFMEGTEDALDQVFSDGAADAIEILLYMVATVDEEGVTDVHSYLDRAQARAAAGMN